MEMESNLNHNEEVKGDNRLRWMTEEYLSSVRRFLALAGLSVVRVAAEEEPDAPIYVEAKEKGTE